MNEPDSFASTLRFHMACSQSLWEFAVRLVSYCDFEAKDALEVADQVAEREQE